MDTRSNSTRLADLMSEVIVEFARDKGISIKEARKIFISGLQKLGKKFRTGTAEYDPDMDPSHPKHGWHP